MGFLALSVESDRADVLRTVNRLGLKLPVAFTSGENEVLAPLGVRDVPSTIFVNAQGIIVSAATGPRKAGYFRRRVKELLEPSRR